MSLRDTPKYENSLDPAKPFIFNVGLGHFQGRFLGPKSAALGTTGGRRRNHTTNFCDSYGSDALALKKWGKTPHFYRIGPSQSLFCGASR